MDRRMTPKAAGTCPPLVFLVAAFLSIRSGPSAAATIVWDLAGSPYVLTSDFVVGPGDVLRIEPGVAVRLNPDVSVRIEGGRLEAIGTQTDSVLFTPNQPGLAWDALRLQNSDGNLVRYARVEGASREDVTYGAAIELYSNSSLEMTHCEIRNCEDAAFYSRVNCEFLIADCFIHDVGGAGIHGSQGSAGSVYRCEIGHTVHDGLDLNGNPSHPDDQIIGNIVHDSLDDGIDLDFDFSGTIAGNVIYRCNDKGISVSTESYALAYNNVIYDCTSGIVVQAGARADLSNCAISGCGRGLAVYWGSTGYPPPIASAKNIVSWNCTTRSVYVDGASTLTATYCDFEEIFPGTGNISLDPLFADAGANDFHLTALSPCIDSGTSEWPAPSVDIEGRLRVDDPDTPNSGGGLLDYFDMGAYEFAGEAVEVDDATAFTVHRELDVFPNPVRNPARAHLALHEPSSVALRLFDARGRLVGETVHARVAAGDHAFPLPGAGGADALPPGVYVLVADFAGIRSTVKIVRP
jgi:parallel beta-helix repeat protein